MGSADYRLAFANRLSEACDRAGIPPKGRGRYGRIGKMFGVSRESARKWLEGEGLPDTERIPEIARVLRVAGEWLLTGRSGSTPPAPDLRLAMAIEPWIELPR